VDYIAFRATVDSYAHTFAFEMKEVFEKSMTGELTYFLGFKFNNLSRGCLFLKPSMPKAWSRNLVLIVRVMFASP
jgi:hypothetical protein